MSGVDASGVAVQVAGPAMLAGTDGEIRGLVGRFLVAAGLPVPRASKILRASRSQFYDDLRAARGKDRGRDSDRPREDDEAA